MLVGILEKEVQPGLSKDLETKDIRLFLRVELRTLTHSGEGTEP